MNVAVVTSMPLRSCNETLSVLIKIVRIYLINITNTIDEILHFFFFFLSMRKEKFGLE